MIRSGNLFRAALSGWRQPPISARYFHPTRSSSRAEKTDFSHLVQADPARRWVLQAAFAGFLVGAAIASSAAETAKAAGGKIDFNRQVRPILSENCFSCHGPDEKERKAKLRFDLRDEALKPAKSGTPAIVPGDPAKSELIVRITEKDPDEVMPPIKSGKSLSPQQIEVLRDWVAQGASYATHWSYVKPVRPELPAVKKKEWPRNGVDFFVLARLEKEGLSPSPEADRYALIRRVSLDLTGLPPTLEEVEQFVKDGSAGAYEGLVDRLLQKKTYGEHWAQKWLDLARYADSAGYADDPLRSIWAYRDYVIRSFNEDKPFDQFTIEQLAGDLLENPDEEQLTATAFHRNTMTNNEGGTNDEEFRNAAIVDRVNTTMAVWMGTSMACAQCHTHKYDPLTQEEYFRFFAFFNNTEDADKPDESPVLKFFTNQQKEARKKLETEMEGLDKKLTTPTEELLTQEEKWRTGFPKQIGWEPLKPGAVKYVREGTLPAQKDGVVSLGSGKGSETYTFEVPVSSGQLSALKLELLGNDAAPPAEAGASRTNRLAVSRLSAQFQPGAAGRISPRFVRIELPGTNKILSLAEVQVFNPRENVAPRGQATQSSTDQGGDAARAIDGNTSGDYAQAKSTTHTTASENPWWELDLKSAEDIQRVVIWNRTDADTGKRLGGFRIVLLDEKREPLFERTLKQPPAPSLDLPVNGPRPVRFTSLFAQEEGAGDLGALTAEKPDPAKTWTTTIEPGQPRALTLLTDSLLPFSDGAKLTVSVQTLSDPEPRNSASLKLYAAGEERLIRFAGVPGAALRVLTKPEAERTEPERKLLTEYYLRNLAPSLQPERERLAAAKKEFDDIKAKTVPIYRELTADKRRKTHIEYRGDFLSLGKEVSEGVPAVFPPLPEGAPLNRLTLAKWLVDPANPLTARVIANRFWEQIFGVGIVRTSEEFGSQGEVPSNQDLLDWLATELIAQKWDLKKFVKMLVTSAAYRQSAAVTSELQERDPENRLLARGPRFRLSGEMVRDQALFVAGLLSDKMYGPSVKPPRPSSGLSAAFGSSVDWQTSDGEDSRRRGLYTEWRRTSPYPSLTTFDAPNREVCTLRRNRTNTPLQALVTLNDPVFLQAAQALARRMMGSGESAEARMRYGFRLCLARAPREPEIARLMELLEQARTRFAGDAANAEKIAGAAGGAKEGGSPPVEVAAWTTVANVLLNLDEVLMKR